MKKLGKIVACGLALASVAGTYAEMAPHKETLKADAQIEQMLETANFKVEGIPFSAKVGDEITIPSLAEVGADSVVVKNFYGKEVAVTANKFTVADACDHIVTFTKNETSKSFVIKVSGEEEAITFAQNSQNFIPTEMFKGQKLVLPAPTNEDVKEYKVYVNNSATALTETQDDNFVFVAGDAGSYSLRYEVKFNDDHVVNRTETLNVVNTNAYTIKVGHELAGTMPTTIEAGQKVTLPKVNTFNLDNNSDPLTNHTKVQVKYFDKNGVASDVSVEEDGLTFTPAKLADGTSYYEIKYTVNTVHSSFGNDEAEAINLTYQIRDVKDTKLDFKDLDLKSTVLAGPVTFTPEFKDEFDANAEIKVTIKKRDKSEIEVTKNTNGSYTFTAVAGERYTIVLNGKDASGNEKTTSGYIVNAVSQDEASPEFKEDIVSDFVTALEDQEVSFVLPKAEDNIAKDLIYTVSVNDGAVTTFTYEDKDGNAKTDLTATPLVAGDKVYFTMPDVAAKIKVTVSDGTTTSEKTYTIKLKDNTAPTLTLDAGVNNVSGSVQQGETINIPTFTVADSNIFSAQVNYNLYIDGVDHSDSIYGSVSKTYRSASLMEVSGYKFVAATAGEAELYITATDADNNIAVKVYKFTIDSTSNAVMSIGKMPTDVEVYEKTALPTPEFKDGTERVWHVVAIGEEIPAHQIIEEGGKRYFIAEKPGTFVLEYVVFDANFDIETRSVAYTITAKDSKAPIFTLDNNVAVPSILPFNAGQESAEIFLPGFKSVSDSDSLNNVKSYKLTVKDTDNETYTVEFDNKSNKTESNSTILSYDNATNKFKLKVNQIGTYTFEYSVVDLNGNTTTIDSAKHVNGEMKLVVGDIFAPTMDDSKLNIKRVYKEGETFVANIKDLVLDDNITEFDTALEEYKDKNLTVALYNGSTQIDIVVDSKTGDITLKEGGALEVGENYRLVLNLKDEAGKVSPLTYNISVKAKETKAVSHEKVWGIVLICVSVAVLGAVVVYFVATREKKAPAKFAKKEEEKVEAKPENEEN